MGLKTHSLAAALSCMIGQSADSDPFDNPNYVIYPHDDLIQRDMSDLARVYRRNYSKFITYFAPNGGEILLVATDGTSDEQLLRAYNILDFFLTDVPGSQYGSDKSAVANAMADSGAVLVMPGGADGDSPIWQSALQGQPLYALEFPTEGSAAYINNDYDQRDAGFEEIFHMVHDNGIGTQYTGGPLKATFQADISAAMQNALQNGLWGAGDRDTQNWISELRAEGSLEQEYIASVLDSYYGYWGAWDEADGGMWGIYTSKTRADITRLDPMGAALVAAFLPETVTYMARIDPAFSGTFHLGFDANRPYTHKSQYLVNARLLGDQPSNLSGNDHPNVFMGNTANNVMDGKAGRDVVQYPVPSSEVVIERNGQDVRISGEGIGTDELRNIEILRFADRDIILTDI